MAMLGSRTAITQVGSCGHTVGPQVVHVWYRGNAQSAQEVVQMRHIGGTSVIDTWGDLWCTAVGVVRPSVVQGRFRSTQTVHAWHPDVEKWWARVAPLHRWSVTAK